MTQLARDHRVRCTEKVHLIGDCAMQFKEALLNVIACVMVKVLARENWSSEIMHVTDLIFSPLGESLPSLSSPFLVRASYSMYLLKLHSLLTI